MNDNNNIHFSLRSSLKKTTSNNNDNNNHDQSITIQPPRQPETSKSVRFATVWSGTSSNSNSKQYPREQHQSSSSDIYCLIQEYEKEDCPIQSLFWTPQELDENLQDKERSNMIALLEPSYGAALQSAYDQSSKALTSDVHIQLDLPPTTTRTRTRQHGDEEEDEEEEEVATARGLELDLMPTNTVQKLTLKHRRAVLLVQEKLRSDGRCMSDEFCLELLAKASRRYSRPSRLVAFKLGEYDSSCTNNATTTTTNTTTSEPPEDDLLDTSSTEMDTTTTTTTTTGRTESSVVCGVVVAAAKNQQTISLSSFPSPSSSSSHMQSSKKNSILWSQGAHEESFYEQQ
ncbi:hypothetical protein ACA910_013693 [Epithemia clementina (nom. ined.)]